MRVVFMGTPDIAATCLNKIIEKGYEIVGVYTQPDRPKNRGMKLAFSPVKEVAIAHDLPDQAPRDLHYLPLKMEVQHGFLNSSFRPVKILCT